VKKFKKGILRWISVHINFYNYLEVLNLKKFDRVIMIFGSIIFI
jgi:hypothetical protein